MPNCSYACVLAHPARNSIFLVWIPGAGIAAPHFTSREAALDFTYALTHQCALPSPVAPLTPEVQQRLTPVKTTAARDRKPLVDRAPDEDILALYDEATLLRSKFMQARHAYEQTPSTTNKLTLLFARRKLNAYITK